MKPMLDGVRIVDMAQMLAGGYGSMLLGDLGAEMIKIEQVEVGDRTRLLGYSAERITQLREGRVISGPYRNQRRNHNAHRN
jgi:crotonobetainyl-CoA:carnitine CoA-transferase CaiB-like acyl-CoA transferase